MVKDVVLWADISELPDPIEKPEIAEGIPLRRKSKIFTYRLPHNRRQCLCSGLFEKYISDIYGFSTVDFGVDNNGKPQINNDIGINYSISHSNNIVICAVSRNNIGCDIEKIKTISSNIAERFFCEGEKAYLKGFSDSEFENEFFRLWTIKESYIKMIGTGLRMGLAGFEIFFDKNANKRAIIKRKDKIENCSIREYCIPDNNSYKISVCTENDDFCGILRHFEIGKYL